MKRHRKPDKDRNKKKRDRNCRTSPGVFEFSFVTAIASSLQCHVKQWGSVLHREKSSTRSLLIRRWDISRNSEQLTQDDITISGFHAWRAPPSARRVKDRQPAGQPRRGCLPAHRQALLPSFCSTAFECFCLRYIVLMGLFVWICFYLNYILDEMVLRKRPWRATLSLLKICALLFFFYEADCTKVYESFIEMIQPGKGDCTAITVLIDL